MPKGNEPTTKFKVDISELKKNIQDAQRIIRLANAEFKAASSGMDDWSKSADGISAKLKQLDTVLNAQKTVLTSLEQEYALVAKEQGESSKGAQELAIKIANQQAAINNTQKSIAQYEQALKDVDNESKDVESSSEKLSDNIKDAGKEAESAEGGFTVLKGTLASLAAEGIKKCAEALGELTKELITDGSAAYAQFAAATGTATEAMGQYEEAIKNVYKNNFGESLEDVANKMAKVKEVTGELDASKLQDMTEKAMTLEDTFDMDMTETLRGVQSLMNHFGLTAEEAFDLMASGAQNGLNYTDELGDNVSEYAGKFAEAGYSSEEYFQLLKNGAQGGAYNLDKVNDAINEVTARLADGTIEDGLSGFSQGTQEIFKSWQNGGATQKEVIDSIVKDIQNTTGEQEKMNLAALAFGTMAEDGGTKFIEALSPVGDTFSDVKGKAEELAAVKYDTPQAALQGIGRTLKTDLLGPLVDKLMPTINDVAAWVTDNLPIFIENVKGVATEAKDVVTELEKWTPLIAGIGAAIATYFAVTQIAAFVGWIKSGAAAIKMMEIAQAALNVVMNMNPIGIIIALIAGLVAAFVILWNKSDKFREFWINLWEGIKDACGNAKEWIGEKIDEIGKFFTETLPNAFKSVIDWIKKNWLSILTFLINPFAGLFTYFYKNNSKFKEFVDNAIKSIKQLPGKLWEQFKLAIAKVVAFFSDILGKAKTKGSEFVSNLVNKIKELPNKMWEKFLLAVQKVVDLGTKLKSKAQEAGKKMVDGVIEKIKGLPDDVKSVGKNIVEGLWNGINDKFSWLTGKIKSFASDVTSKLKSFFGIKSPSRVMRDQVGKYLALGVAAGIDKNKDAVTQSMKDLADSVSQPFDIGYENIKSKVNSAVRSASNKNGFNGNANTQNTTYTFNQYNSSPKALSRLEIYRQTKNQLNFAKGV